MAGDSKAICTGSINTQTIYDTHTQIKKLVTSFKDLNYRVSSITEKAKENWRGEGRNEFESQYNLLINKIEDFGDSLQEIYEALVKAEASYESTDNEIRQELVLNTAQ